MTEDTTYTDSYITSCMEDVCLSLGYSELRSQQKDAIKAFVAAHDVFVSLPTGFGKSLIYGCLPLLFDKLRCKLKPSLPSFQSLLLLPASWD